MDPILDLHQTSLAWFDRSAPSRRTWLIQGSFFVFSVLTGIFLSLSGRDCTQERQYFAEEKPNNPGCAITSSLARAPFEVPVYGEDTGKIAYRGTNIEPADSQYEFVRFNGNPEAPSPYKGPPSAKVDAAWDALWAANMLVPERLFWNSEPQYPEASVKDHTRDGFYFATFEATHYLHCLYTLFRASYVDYYKPEREFLLHDPDRYHVRLDHCTDILRQKLMCDSDSSIVTYNWVYNQSRPVPNYSVLHRCRKHDVLLAWSEKHAATGAVFSKADASLELDADP